MLKAKVQGYSTFMQPVMMKASIRFSAPFKFLPKATLRAAVGVLLWPAICFGQAAIPLGTSADQLQQLQQLQQQYGRQAPLAAVPELPQSTVVQPEPLRAVPEAPSRVEEILSQRAGSPLRLFGYDTLGSGRAVSISQPGAMQDGYILGPGDEILVSLRGQESTESRAIVNRDGQVILPRLNPIPASGRSLGSFREDVQNAVRRAYVATEAFVAVGRVRQISVLVAGEVNIPGQRNLPGLGSVLDAILLSGGIKKSGSLRHVRIVRGGREIAVDLYAALGVRDANSADLRLADGDRIIVPLLGPVVAVSGMVRHPAIYELPAGRRSIAANALISMAGGEEVRGLYLLSALRIGANGQSSLAALANDSEAIADSEVLFVQPGADQVVNRARLSGSSGLAGSFPIVNGTLLSTRLKAPGALGQKPYTLFGILSRRDPRTLLRTLTAFTPVAVLAGKEDIVLQADDILRPISVDEMRLMVSAARDFRDRQSVQQEALRNPLSVKSDTTGGEVASASAVAAAANAADRSGDERVTARSAAGRVMDFRPNSSLDQSALATPPERATGRSVGDAGRANGAAQEVNVTPRQLPVPNFQEEVVEPGGYASNREVSSLDQIAYQLGVDTLVLMNFLSDNGVMLSGAVRGPGEYLIGSNVALEDLVIAAGGTSNWADVSSVELLSTFVDPVSGRSQTRLNRLALGSTTLASYVVKPHDEFRFNQVFTDTDVGNVTLQGEVRFAGAYKLTRGERLSDLLQRAGGLTNSAYPFGTVFLRKSAAAREQEGYVRAAKEVQDQILAAMTRIGNDKLDPTTFTALQSFVGELRNQKALGRIAVQADPSVLASRPAQDPMLEAGDVIYIPPRPSTISVLGQVMQAGSFPYEAGMSPRDYIERAGGYGTNADDGNTYIVLPDGTARKMERSWLRFASTSLPPGSAIVVPRDITPLDMRQTIIDVSQILSQLAVSIASVAVISR